jgi:hypothetical protein
MHVPAWGADSDAVMACAGTCLGEVIAAALLGGRLADTRLIVSAEAKTIRDDGIDDQLLEAAPLRQVGQQAEQAS